MKANSPDGGNRTASEVPCAVCWSILKKYTSAGTMTSPPPIPIIPAKIPAPIPKANPPSRRVFIRPSEAKQISGLPRYRIAGGLRACKEDANGLDESNAGAGVGLLVGVVAGAHQRSGLDVLEPHSQRGVFQLAKLGG